MNYTVRSFYEQFGTLLSLKLIAGKEGMQRLIKIPEVQRPGLSLAGYMGKRSERILIFGRIEISFLKDIESSLCMERLKILLGPKTPAVIVARGLKPLPELVKLCEKERIPLLSSEMATMTLLSKLIFLLGEELSPRTTCHGTLVEVFGTGVLIQGESSIGKSEAALGLIERGHRLVSDDIVYMRKREGSYLEGSGAELTRHLMEIRGIGIINVVYLYGYGAVSVGDKNRVDIVVKLEEWDDGHFYDRVGLEEKHLTMLGVRLPHYILPVKPGRDVVLLVETIVLTYRQKEMGYHSAKEFSGKLQQTIARKKRKQRG